MIKCETVENAIRGAMEDWLDAYILQINSNQESGIDPIQSELDAVRSQLAGLQIQQENICDYLEKGIYTIDMFTKRNPLLTKEISRLQRAEADLLFQQSEGDKRIESSLQIIPTTQHILDHYHRLTIDERNRLWKLVLKKATVYRSKDGTLTIHFYPNIPQ